MAEYTPDSWDWWYFPKDRDTSLPLSILQLDPADRAVLRIAGKCIHYKSNAGWQNKRFTLSSYVKDNVQFELKLIICNFSGVIAVLVKWVDMCSPLLLHAKYHGKKNIGFKSHLPPCFSHVVCVYISGQMRSPRAFPKTPNN